MEPASPLDPISRAPGERRVGSYRLLKKIGQGGMGVVHEAQRGDEPPVALKMLRERPEDPDAIRRFHREARALMAINTRSQISSRGELLGRLLARLTGPG